MLAAPLSCTGRTNTQHPSVTVAQTFGSSLRLLSPHSSLSALCCSISAPCCSDIALCAISRPRAACLWQIPRHMVGVVVKWGKQTFEVELDTSDSVETFKAQLFALTSVPIERQKIMGVKGGTLKDDAKFDALGIKPGQKLMMMGSADVLAAPPPTATVFAEDLPQVTQNPHPDANSNLTPNPNPQPHPNLPQEAIDAAEATNPAGLANLGNTCYLNSSLQCLRAIPEVSTSLQKFVGESGAAVSPANAEGNARQHGQNFALGSARARLLRLRRVRLAALAGSTLPGGRGRPSGHRATASGARARRLRLHTRADATGPRPRRPSSLVCGSSTRSSIAPTRPRR